MTIKSFKTFCGKLKFKLKPDISELRNELDNKLESVDFHWKDKNGELLVNIDIKANAAAFYGDNYPKFYKTKKNYKHIKGRFSSCKDLIPLLEFIWR